MLICPKYSTGEVGLYLSLVLKWVQLNLNCALSEAFEHGSEQFISFNTPHCGKICVNQIHHYYYDYFYHYYYYYYYLTSLLVVDYSFSIMSHDYLATMLDDQYSRWWITHANQLSLYPVLMKEWQSGWNWSATMDLSSKRTQIGQI